VVGPLYENPAHGFASRFLTFQGGARLEVMTTTTIEPVTHAPGAQRMGLTHIAIALGSEAQVDALTERLRRLGTPVVDGPRRTGDGYYESVILDPEGNRVELTA
jgi:lactoylglutathione lyase